MDEQIQSKYFTQRQVEALRQRWGIGPRLEEMHRRHGTTPGRICADCRHCGCYWYAAGGEYFKCVAYSVSHSRVSDWRRWWPACGLFAEGEGPSLLCCAGNEPEYLPAFDEHAG